MTDDTRRPSPGPIEPQVVMHEDDPILVHKYPTKFNRKNIRRLIAVMAALTMILVLFNQYQIYAERQARSKFIDDQLKSFACLIVKNFPDSSAPIVKTLRDTYHCPPYKAPKKLPVSSKKTTPAKPTTSRNNAGARPTPSATPTRDISKPSSVPVTHGATVIQTHTARATVTSRPAPVTHTKTVIAAPPSSILCIPGVICLPDLPV